MRYVLDDQAAVLSKAEYDDVVTLAWSEAVFQRAVEEWYFLAGWLVVWHDNFSLRNEPGFPDIVAAGRPPWLPRQAGTSGTHYRELKKAGGSVSRAQKTFGAAIQADGGDWAVRFTRDWRLVRAECGLTYLLDLAAQGDTWAIRFLYERQALLAATKRDRKATRATKRAKGGAPRVRP